MEKIIKKILMKPFLNLKKNNYKKININLIKIYKKKKVINSIHPKISQYQLIPYYQNYAYFPIRN